MGDKKVDTERWCACPRCGRRHRTREAQVEFTARASTCVECGRECSDVYQVEDVVWRGAGMSPMDGVLHFSCLEKRLGRPLNILDFTTAPINGALRFGYSTGVIRGSTDQ